MKLYHDKHVRYYTFLDVAGNVILQPVVVQRKSVVAPRPDSVLIGKNVMMRFR